MSLIEKVASAYEGAYEKLAMERLHDEHPNLPRGFHEALRNLEKEAGFAEIAKDVGTGLASVGSRIGKGVANAGARLGEGAAAEGSLAHRMGQLGGHMAENGGATAAGLGAAGLGAAGLTGVAAGRASKR